MVAAAAVSLGAHVTHYKLHGSMTSRSNEYGKPTVRPSILIYWLAATARATVCDTAGTIA